VQSNFRTVRRARTGSPPTLPSLRLRLAVEIRGDPRRYGEESDWAPAVVSPQPVTGATWFDASGRHFQQA
jgi:hypothetical protein